MEKNIQKIRKILILLEKGIHLGAIGQPKTVWGFPDDSIKLVRD